MSDRVFTLEYIEALPGATVEDTYREATRAGVNYFLHNDRLYRLSAWCEIGTLDTAKLKGDR